MEPGKAASDFLRDKDLVAAAPMQASRLPQMKMNPSSPWLSNQLQSLADQSRKIRPDFASENGKKGAKRKVCLISCFQP